MTNVNQTEKAQLLARKQELEERLAAIDRDYQQGLDADSAERAVQLENAEVLEGIGKAAVEELEQVEARLAELG